MATFFMAMASTRRDEIVLGARAIFPLLVGTTPFGIIFGTLAQSSGLSFGASMALSLIVFAGSAQFVAVGLVASGTAIPIIIFTTFIVNLRHLLYSASLVPYVGHLNAGWKSAIAFFLTDESFAASIGYYRQPGDSSYRHWHYLSASLIMYLNWALWTLVGLSVGRLIPNAASWGLDFAMVATFIGMVVPYINRLPMAIAVLVSGIVAGLAHGLPHQLGIILAALAGVAAGVISDRQRGDAFSNENNAVENNAVNNAKK